MLFLSRWPPDPCRHGPRAGSPVASGPHIKTNGIWGYFRYIGYFRKYFFIQVVVEKMEENLNNVILRNEFDKKSKRRVCTMEYLE